MSQQGLRHASFRAIGGTTGTYGDDARAAFEAEATIPAGATYNEAFMLWLQERLGSSDDNLPNLMAAFAAQEGATNWGAVGSFDPAAEILEVSIAASADDARETISTGNVSITATLATLSATNSDLQGLRFQNITIPQGATITNATIQLTATQEGSGDHTTTISGQADDAADAFTTASGSLTSRGKTTATVDWVISDWAANDRTAAQLSPNIASVIQEIVDRPGWASGNALALFLQQTGGSVNRQYATWDNSTLQEAMLTIEWEE